jgi:hypothetical protein
LVFEGELSLRPAPAPAADGVGVELGPQARLDVGEAGLIGKQQGEAGALLEVSAGRAATDEVPRLPKERGREAGLVER